jgi:hypothetical protein
MFCASLNEESRHDYHWSLLVAGGAQVTCYAGVMLLIIGAVLWLSHRAVPLQIVIVPQGVLLTATGVMLNGWYTIRKQHLCRMIRKLGGHLDAIGPALLLMHSEQEKQVTVAASEVLKRTLPALTELHDIGLKPAHNRALEFMLKSPDTDLVQVAVTALKFVGDEKSVPAIAAMLEDDSLPQDLRTAGAECLSSIHSRISATRSAKSLLRGVTGDGLDNEYANGLLLHPMAETTAEEADEYRHPIS